jgi:hypothetical protein
VVSRLLQSLGFDARAAAGEGRLLLESRAAAQLEELMLLRRRRAMGGAVGSSGQRGRAWKSNPSVRPSLKRSSAAQAIITALSVHSARGGATNVNPAVRGALFEFDAQRGICRNAAGDDE